MLNYFKISFCSAINHALVNFFQPAEFGIKTFFIKYIILHLICFEKDNKDEDNIKNYFFTKPNDYLHLYMCNDSNLFVQVKNSQWLLCQSKNGI